MYDNRPMSEVRLVDLDVITRYSLAVRQEWAPAEEILTALESSRQQVLASMGPERRPRRRRPPATDRTPRP